MKHSRGQDWRHKAGIDALQRAEKQTGIGYVPTPSRPAEQYSTAGTCLSFRTRGFHHMVFLQVRTTARGGGFL